MLRSRSLRALGATIAIGWLQIANASAQPKAEPADDASYRAATGLLHRNMPEQAAAEYRAFLKQHPEHAKAAAARYALAVCLSRLGKWTEAGQELDAIADDRSFEFAPDATLLRAQAFAASGDFAHASERAKLLMAMYPTFEQNDSAAALLGESLYRTGDLQAARTALERVVKDWPRSVSRARAELFLALVESAEGDDRAASERLSAFESSFAGSELIPQAKLVEAQCRHRLASRLQGAEAEAQRARSLGLYESASTVERLAPDAMLGRAQLLRAGGDSAKAGVVLDEIVSRFPKSEAARRAKLERARVLIDQGAHARALALLEALTRDEAIADEASYWASKAETRAGQHEAAADRLRRFDETFPKSALLVEATFDYAAALGRSGKSAEACEVYERLRERYPRHALAPESLIAEASLRLSSGDPAGAKDLCQEFATAFPSHPKRGLASLILADAEDASGHPDRAAEQYAAYLAMNPQSKDAALRRGLALCRAGDSDGGAEALRKAIAMNQEVDEALLRSAMLALADRDIARGDWAQAERTLASAATGGGAASPDVLLKLGVAKQRQGKNDEALPLFDRVIQSRGAETAALQASFERAQIFVEQGKLDEARPEFERILKAEAGLSNPRFSVHCRRHLAAIASKQGRTEDAAKLLDAVSEESGAAGIALDVQYEAAIAKLAAGQYEAAERALAKFVQSQPTHPRAADAAAQRAIALSRLGKHGEALAQIEEATALQKSMRPEIAQSLRYERAWVLSQLGKSDEARDAYRALLSEKLPASLEAHATLELAQLEATADQQASALDLLSRALALADGMGVSGESLLQRALYLRGAGELKLNRAPDALATLEGLLTRFPKSDLTVSAELLAGQAALKANRPQAAAAHIQRALDSKPPEETVAPALLCLGEAQAASQQWERSQATFERFAREFSSSEFWFQARFGIAWALENQGRHAEAISAYREVLAKHSGPTAARAQFQIGECYFALKQHDEAARELLKVDILYAYPEWSAAALYEAGRCFAAQNKNAEASVQFQQVIDRFKDTQWANLAAQQLRTVTASRENLPGKAAR